ncbi:MAG: ABC transporter permease, partial [Pseudomonadota bacterium]|nr:ABC transporter permease [Pseudomonadota bacterium]
MWSYILRRVFYAIPILFGVNLLTFSLFFIVNTPDDMARMHLGNKHIQQSDVDHWKKVKGYDKPLFYNDQQQGIDKITDTLFVKKSLGLFTFNFGTSDNGRDIGFDIMNRMWPSLALAIPTLIIGLFVHISFAILMAFFRGTYLDLAGVTICVILMSISSLFYILGGQFLIGKLFMLVPISGYQAGFPQSFKFLILPIIIGVIGGLG